MFRTSIGGVRILVNSSEDIELDPPFFPNTDFLLDVSDQMNQDIIVTINTDPGPLPTDAVKIFDCGEGWSMFSHDDKRIMALQPESFTEPAWIAQFQPAASEITVLCSERMIISGNGKTKLDNPFLYPLSLVASMYYLAATNGAIFHAAGFNVAGRGVLVGGESGAGKSTLSSAIGNSEHTVLSDDRIIVRQQADGIIMYGTPWLGEADFADNGAVPMKSIAFLHRSETPGIKELNKGPALEKLLKTLSIPWYEKDIVDSMLDWCEKLLDNVPAYDLSFNPDADTSSLLEELANSL